MKIKLLGLTIEIKRAPNLERELKAKYGAVAYQYALMFSKDLTREGLTQACERAYVNLKIAGEAISNNDIVVSRGHFNDAMQTARTAIVNNTENERKIRNGITNELDLVKSKLIEAERNLNERALEISSLKDEVNTCNNLLAKNDILINRLNKENASNINEYEDLEKYRRLASDMKDTCAEKDDTIKKLADKLTEAQTTIQLLSDQLKNDKARE